jgi:hypothetical protein
MSRKQGKQKLLGEDILKIIMVGECGVGKSSLICRLVDNTFSDEPVTSLGMDFKPKTVSADGKVLKLQVWVRDFFNLCLLRLLHLSFIHRPCISPTGHRGTGTF